MEVKEREYQGFGFLEEIRHESRGFGGRPFGREEFGSEIPKDGHPNDSSDSLSEATLLLLSSLWLLATCHGGVSRRRHRRRVDLSPWVMESK